ncbi:MAG: universal stress protein [Geobacteraceae bacterium]|nr:universal stress protein [Geobacteraceae bacterium]
MEDIKRILVVSGIARNSLKAFDYGVSLSRKYKAELYLIHVIHNPFGLEGWNLPMRSLKDEYERIIAEAEQNLDEIIALENASGRKVHELIREGRPSEEILTVIEEKNIDLLILGAHEESHLEHMESRMENLIFGRSNDELIRKMPCSILLVKHEP